MSIFVNKSTLKITEWPALDRYKNDQDNIGLTWLTPLKKDKKKKHSQLMASSLWLYTCVITSVITYIYIYVDSYHGRNQICYIFIYPPKMATTAAMTTSPAFILPAGCLPRVGYWEARVSLRGRTDSETPYIAHASTEIYVTCFHLFGNVKIKCPCCAPVLIAAIHT